MKMFGISGIILIALFSLAGCSSKVYVQRDESANLAKYRTYSWVETKTDQNDNRNTTAFAEAAIHNAVNQELSKNGWREVTNDPDVLITHDILVERTSVTQSSPIYSQPFTRVYYNPWMRRWGTVYYPSQFMGYDTYNAPAREGTVTITMIDPRTDKPIWQGWTTEQMENRKMTNEELTNAVHKILKKFEKEAK